MRFTRQQRLLKAKEYQFVFEQPYKLTDPYFTVLARVNQQQFARLGLAIAKKRVSLAVKRNRIKRLIRESFRHHQSSLAGIDVVVLAKNEIDKINNRTLLDSLARHWLKLSRRCKKS
jgi:ribonuclease P protein component